MNTRLPVDANEACTKIAAEDAKMFVCGALLSAAKEYENEGMRDQAALILEAVRQHSCDPKIYFITLDYKEIEGIIAGLLTSLKGKYYWSKNESGILHTHLLKTMVAANESKYLGYTPVILRCRGEGFAFNDKYVQACDSSAARPSYDCAKSIFDAKISSVRKILSGLSANTDLLIANKQAVLEKIYSGRKSDIAGYVSKLRTQISMHLNAMERECVLFCHSLSQKDLKNMEVMINDRIESQFGMLASQLRQSVQKDKLEEVKKRLLLLIDERVKQSALKYKDHIKIISEQNEKSTSSLLNALMIDLDQEVDFDAYDIKLQEIIEADFSNLKDRLDLLSGLDHIEYELKIRMKNIKADLEQKYPNCHDECFIFIDRIAGMVSDNLERYKSNVMRRTDEIIYLERVENQLQGLIDEEAAGFEVRVKYRMECDRIRAVLGHYCDFEDSVYRQDKQTVGLVHAGYFHIKQDEFDKYFCATDKPCHLSALTDFVLAHPFLVKDFNVPEYERNISGLLHVHACFLSAKQCMRDESLPFILDEELNGPMFEADELAELENQLSLLYLNPDETQIKRILLRLNTNGQSGLNRDHAEKTESDHQLSPIPARVTTRKMDEEKLQRRFDELSNNYSVLDKSHREQQALGETLARQVAQKDAEIIQLNQTLQNKEVHIQTLRDETLRQQAESQRLKTENNELRLANQARDVENQNLFKKNTAQAELIVRQDMRIRDLSADKARSENRLGNLSRQQFFLDRFNEFFEHYINYNKQSTSLIFFHGRHGRSVARKFNLSLSAAVKGIDVDQELEAYVHALKSVYHSLINNSNGLLDGAYNNHSFKTYLLAFNKFITPWNGDTDLNNPDVEDYLNRVNIDVDDKKTQYDKIFFRERRILI